MRRVAVLYGGPSPERAVSLVSGKAVAAALRDAGYLVREIDIDRDLAERMKAEPTDVAFLALHGSPGEDGTVQGLLEYLGIPYTGSSVLASALALDKIAAREVLAAHGLPVAPALALTAEDSAPIERRLQEAGLLFPVVVKPATVGSSLGMFIVRGAAGLAPALASAFELASRVLVEQFVAGTEVTVGILGDDHPQALPVIEIVPAGEFYTYETKYVPGKSTHLIPARLPRERYARVQALALAAHQALGCAGWSRVDLIVPDQAPPVILELNTIPGMTPTSLFPEAAKHAGIAFPELVSRLVEWAWSRRRGAGRPAR